LEERGHQDVPFKTKFVSSTGATFSLDDLIGDPRQVGKGLGAITLSRFLDRLATRRWTIEPSGGFHWTLREAG
jgi:hypothetical protein